MVSDTSGFFRYVLIPLSLSVITQVRFSGSFYLYTTRMGSFRDVSWVVSSVRTLFEVSLILWSSFALLVLPVPCLCCFYTSILLRHCGQAVVWWLSPPPLFFTLCVLSSIHRFSWLIPVVFTTFSIRYRFIRWVLSRLFRSLGCFLLPVVISFQSSYPCNIRIYTTRLGGAR